MVIDSRPALSRRTFLGAAAAAALVSPHLAKAASPKKRPNLVFVFSDQQSYDMLGCYGNDQIKTPRTDAFAHEAVRFTHCFSNTPVCTPYRGMLLSGQHPLYNGAWSNDVPMMAENGTSFPQALKNAGYRLGYTGKWHLLGGNRDRPIPGDMRYGFDDPFYTNNCHVDYRPGRCFYWDELDRKVYFPVWEVDGQTSQALDFLDECTPEDPFALFVSWHPPHDWGHQETEPSEVVYRYATEDDLMAQYDPEAIRLRPDVTDSPAVRRAYHGHMAMCTGVDRSFGRILDKLKERGLDDNTIVVFTADHGDLLTSHGMNFPKGTPHDLSARVPLLIRTPERLRPGTTSDLMISALDLPATLLGLMGLTTPSEFQGQDLSGAIRRGDDDAVESVPLFYFAPEWHGVVTRDYSYAAGEVRHWKYTQAGKEIVNRRCDILYDRNADPHQLSNLYGDASATASRERMEQLTRQWMDHFGYGGDAGRKIASAYHRIRQEAGLEGARNPERFGRPIDILQGRSVLS